MMREDFYHSQYGDPEQHPTRYHLDYEEGVEYIEAEGEEVKASETETAARESFLWLSTFTAKVRYPNILSILLNCIFCYCYRLFLQQDHLASNMWTK